MGARSREAALGRSGAATASRRSEEEREVKTAKSGTAKMTRKEML
jgi:hypothetical protein